MKQNKIQYFKIQFLKYTAIVYIKIPNSEFKSLTRFLSFLRLLLHVSSINKSAENQKSAAPLEGARVGLKNYLTLQTNRN